MNGHIRVNAHPLILKFSNLIALGAYAVVYGTTKASNAKLNPEFLCARRPPLCISLCILGPSCLGLRLLLLPVGFGGVHVFFSFVGLGFNASFSNLSSALDVLASQLWVLWRRSRSAALILSPGGSALPVFTS